jgi:hypothetical protein
LIVPGEELILDFLQGKLIYKELKWALYLPLFPAGVVATDLPIPKHD